MNQMHLMNQMRKMQQEMTKAQDELSSTVVTGTAAGEAVKVEMTCDHRVKSISIAPSAIDADDPETIEDLVLVAVNDALTKVQQTSQARMERVTGGLRIPGMT